MFYKGHYLKLVKYVGIKTSLIFEYLGHAYEGICKKGYQIAILVAAYKYANRT